MTNSAWTKARRTKECERGRHPLTKDGDNDDDYDDGYDDDDDEDNDDNETRLKTQ